uniref:RNA polymerase III subunit E n=1 Tax=Eptatretus burgeri TaxID=7764 RepID=A0A8C4R5V4_EPTBU
MKSLLEQRFNAREPSGAIQNSSLLLQIDVYLAKSLAENLYLFQHPVRPATSPYDDVPHLSARIKPRQQKVELELAINVNSASYSQSKGEQIALNVDGTSSEDATYSMKVMDKQVLVSTPAAVDVSRYAIGVFRKGELHLTPLHGMLQLRPGFSYLDKADARHRENENIQDGDSSQEEPEEDVKQITVRFARPESDRARQKRMQSYEYMRQKQSEEPWHHLAYHGSKDSRADFERHYLFAQSSGMVTGSELTKTPKEYLAMLMPQAQKETETKPVTPSNVVSMSQLRTLPLSDQVKTLMKNVKVLQFSQLMGLLGPGTDSTSALRCVQQVSVLVQGCWVVKSEILYPKESRSPYSGVSAEVLCRGRDFLLWEFTRKRFVLRKDILAVVKLPAEDVKDFMEQVAYSRVGRGWEFALPPDAEFVRKHPDVAQRQTMLWQGVQSRLAKTFGLSKEELIGKGDAASPGGLVVISGEQRVRAAQHNLCERSKELEHKYKRFNNLSVARTGRDANSLECQGNDGEFALTGLPNGLNVVSGSCADKLAAELLEFVRQRLCDHPVLSLSELRGMLNLRLTELPPGHVLGSGVSDRALQDALARAGAKHMDVPLPMNDSGEDVKIFALWDTGSSFDKSRQALLEMFTKNYRYRRASLQTALTNAGAELGKEEFDSLLKECCASRSGMWYLKGTLPC